MAKRYSLTEKHSLLRAYELSGQSLAVFSRSCGVSAVTLRSWQRVAGLPEVGCFVAIERAVVTPCGGFSPRLVFLLPQYRRPSAALGVFSPRANVKQDACVLEMPFLKTPRRSGKVSHSCIFPKDVHNCLLMPADSNKWHDLAIRLHHLKERILLVEGKRLYDKYDKQYVSGNTGGICRFKREQHGSEMNQACIVGYMETENFSFWQEKVNNWIDDEKSKSIDVKWGEDELLYTSSISGQLFAHLTSNHLRITKSSISLYHYWVDVRSTDQ